MRAGGGASRCGWEVRGVGHDGMVRTGRREVESSSYYVVEGMLVRILFWYRDGCTRWTAVQQRERQLLRTPTQRDGPSQLSSAAAGHCMGMCIRHSDTGINRKHALIAIFGLSDLLYVYVQRQPR